MWSNALLAPLPKGKLFVLCSPAGAGKTTLLRKIIHAFPDIKTSPSYTTRSRRSDEVDGREYHFVLRVEFLRRQAAGEFLETIELHGQLYGTSRREITSLLAAGRHVFLAIDTRGAFSLQKIFDPVLIFLKAPSLSVLRERLIGRGSEDAVLVETRLDWAKRELAEEKHFHYSIVNDSLEDAFSVLASILVAETHRVSSSVRDRT